MMLHTKNWVERESEKSHIQYIPAALFIYHYKDGFAILFQSRVGVGFFQQIAMAFHSEKPAQLRGKQINCH